MYSSKDFELFSISEYYERLLLNSRTKKMYVLVYSIIAGKFMVVDSFHAMVSSIIFQRDFVVVSNKKRSLSRFQSLLKGLGLADRLVFNKDEALMVAGRPINWYNVQERLNSLRDKSYCFLQNALGK